MYSIIGFIISCLFTGINMGCAIALLGENKLAYGIAHALLAGVFVYLAIRYSNRMKENA